MQQQYKVSVLLTVQQMQKAHKISNDLSEYQTDIHINTIKNRLTRILHRCCSSLRSTSASDSHGAEDWLINQHEMKRGSFDHILDEECTAIHCIYTTYQI